MSSWHNDSLIAWRIGWVVAPGELLNDASRVAIYTGLGTSGFAQIGARVALQETPAELAAINAEWLRRAGRDDPPATACRSCRLLAARPFSSTPDHSASSRRSSRTTCSTRRLPQRRGGDVAARHIPFAFSNEPVERLTLLGDRVRRAISTARAET